MKRWFVVGALLLIALALFLWWQNTDDPNVLYEELLTEELKEEINAALIKQYDTEVNWKYKKHPCLGTINGCTIVQTPGTMPMMTAHGVLEIAGYIFEQWGSFDLYAYRNGEACQLQEAYEEGWLTKEQIEVIHRKSHEYYAMETTEKRETAGELDIYGEPFSEPLKQEISVAFSTQYGTDIDWDDPYTFYGMRKGCAIFMTAEQKADSAYCMQLICRFPFEWRYPFNLYAYRDGEVCLLEEACEREWLGLNDISLMRERNVAYYVALYNS